MKACPDGFGMLYCLYRGTNRLTLCFFVSRSRRISNNDMFLGFYGDEIGIDEFGVTIMTNSVVPNMFENKML